MAMHGTARLGQEPKVRMKVLLLLDDSDRDSRKASPISSIDSISRRYIAALRRQADDPAVECSHDRLGAVLDPELREAVHEMRLHGGLAQVEHACDLLIAAATGDQLQHLDLPGAERGSSRTCHPSHQPGGHSWRQGGATGCRGTNGVQQLFSRRVL